MDVACSDIVSIIMFPVVVISRLFRIWFDQNTSE